MFRTKELSPLCSAFTSVDGRFHGGWQLDAVVHPLTVTNPSTLAALNSFLNQEAKHIAWILRAGAVPLWRAQWWGVKSGSMMWFIYRILKTNLWYYKSLSFQSYQDCYRKLFIFYSVTKRSHNVCFIYLPYHHLLVFYDQQGVTES